MPNKIVIQEQLKLVDDVFHPLVIALERYEAFLEMQRTGTESSLSQVATHTDGDCSDYSPETVNNGVFLHRQLRVECITLHNQTWFEEDSIAKISNRYFLEDLLEWYGGREDNIPYNEIDAFGYPIICSICQVVPTPADIRAIIESYIKELPKIEPDQNDIEKALANYIKAEHDIHEKMHQQKKANSEYIIRHHKRGTMKDGYERLFMAFISLFKDDVPAKTLCRVIKDFLPELSEECPSINEDSVDTLMIQKDSKTPVTLVEDVPFEKLDENPSEDDTKPEKAMSDDWIEKARELYKTLKNIFEN